MSVHFHIIFKLINWIEKLHQLTEALIVPIASLPFDAYIDPNFSQTNLLSFRWLNGQNQICVCLLVLLQPCLSCSVRIHVILNSNFGWHHICPIHILSHVHASDEMFPFAYFTFSLTTSFTRKEANNKLDELTYNFSSNRLHNAHQRCTQ